MLRIRYAKREGCDISAKPTELRAVSEVISQLASAGHGSHLVAGDTSGSPNPYDQFLSELIVQVTSGPVCATVDGKTLRVVAGAEFLASFATFFVFGDDTPAGHHHHHDYWEGNSYVSPNSVSLVIGVGDEIHAA